MSWKLAVRLLITVVFSIGAALSVLSIDKPRRPLTPRVAVGVVALDAAVVCAVWVL